VYCGGATNVPRAVLFFPTFSTPSAALVRSSMLLTILAVTPYIHATPCLFTIHLNPARPMCASTYEGPLLLPPKSYIIVPLSQTSHLFYIQPHIVSSSWYCRAYAALRTCPPGLQRRLQHSNSSRYHLPSTPFFAPTPVPPKQRLLRLCH
jgi:hypothetical protein